MTTHEQIIKHYVAQYHRGMYVWHDHGDSFHRNKANEAVSLLRYMAQHSVDEAAKAAYTEALQQIGEQA